MRTVYLDTSLLVSALTDEPLGSSARRAIAADRGERPLISEWVLTEFSSALGLKVRQKVLPEQKASEAIDFLADMIRSDIEVVEIRRSHFRAAATMCRHFGVGLRAPDALHLAVGAANGALVLTLDEKMWRAGQALDVEVSLVA